MAKRTFKKEKYIKNRLSDRTGLFTFQVFIDYTDDDFEKQRYTKSFSEKDYSTAKDAMDAACKHRDKKLNELSTFGLTKKDKFTVGEIFNFIDEVFPARLSTQKKRKVNYNKYIKPEFHYRDISSLSSYDIQVHLNSHVSDCSNDLLRRLYYLWFSLFKISRMKRVIYSDPTETVSIPKSLEHIEKRDTYTDYSIISKIIEGMLTNSNKNEKDFFNTQIICYALQTLYETGMRPSECFALSKADIDFKNNRIHVNKMLGTSKTEENTIRSTKTTKSERFIPFSESFSEILRELFELQDSDNLFARFDGEFFKTVTVDAKIKNFCKKNNIEFNMYRCRHKLSSDLVTSNTDIKTVMEILGHASFNTTTIYSHSNEKLKKEAIEKRKLN